MSSDFATGSFDYRKNSTITGNDYEEMNATLKMFNIDHVKTINTGSAHERKSLGIRST